MDSPSLRSRAVLNRRQWQPLSLPAALGEERRPDRRLSLRRRNQSLLVESFGLPDNVQNIFAVVTPWPIAGNQLSQTAAVSIDDMAHGRIWAFVNLISDTITVGVAAIE